MHKIASRFMLLALMVLAASQIARAEQTIAYPTVESPAFTISAPDEWTFAVAEEEGDYFSLAGPTDATLYFRTVAAEEEGLMAAIEETQKYIEETYSDVEFGDISEDTLNGMNGFSAIGTGNDSEGNSYVFVFGWYDLGNGQLVEVWFEAGNEDADGRQAAAEVLKTLKTP